MAKHYPDKAALLADFRIYYNHTIHPELLRLERRRLRLLGLLTLSVFLLLALFILALFLDILAFTLFLMLPIGFYFAYLIYLFQQFRITFKPQVVNLILDFVDDLPFIQELNYDPKKKIEKARFQASSIFASDAPHYRGEDWIKGRIRELPFEMCELDVREFSRVRSRLDYVFRGIFLHATSNETFRGTVIILPRHFKQYLSRSVRQANRKGAKEYHNLHNPEFEEVFMTYATLDAPLRNLLSKAMQDNLLHYREITAKEIYASFIDGEIYIAITESRNLLEPSIFASNLSFDLIRIFFEDILLLIQFVEDFDEYH
jgi:hypothetical protein